MTKHVIELNGHKYDALTGTRLDNATPQAVQARKQPSVGKNLDGFSRPSRSARQASSTFPTTKLHQQPQKSQTLMRKVVKKPATPAKIHAKAPATSPAATKRHTVPSKVLAETVKPGRAIRANAIPKSNLISKFGQAAASIKTEVLPVRDEPAHNATKPTHAPKAKATAPIVNHAKQTIAQANPFQNAIDQSASHEQTKLKKARLHHRVARKLHVSPNIVSVTAVSLAVLIVGGLLAYQNMPELAMRVAATRAGLRASLPSYQPSGFAMAGPIKYQPGEVTVSYKSASDERSFNVIQKNSSWNSETLLENFVAATKAPYQTFQSSGRTIYIYGDNKATWVDGGIWYNIDGQANLNSDQLLRIAGSL